MRSRSPGFGSMAPAVKRSHLFARHATLHQLLHLFDHPLRLREIAAGFQHPHRLRAGARRLLIRLRLWLIKALALFRILLPLR